MRTRRHGRRLLLWVVIAAALTLSVAACGGGGDEEGAAPAEPPPAEPAPADTGAPAEPAPAEPAPAEPAPAEPAEGGALPDLAYVEEQINTFKAIPEFVPPGPPFDASQAQGKTIFNIPISSEIPFVQTIDQSMMEVAERFGIEFIEFPNQGQPSQWVQGISQAIAQKVDLIVLQGAPDPAVLQPQLEQAEEAGIPVMLGHIWDEEEPLPPNVDAAVPVPFKTAARLEADWVILDTQGEASVLVITSDEVVPSKGIVGAIQEEFETRCGPGCKVRVVNVPVTEWATKIQTEVQSAILSDPELNYVIPIYDSMSQFVVPGITAAGAKGRVEIATFNGTPFVMKMLQDDDDVVMEVGENLAWIGWANMDQAMRILTGQPPVLSPPLSGEQHYLVLRVFDDTNIDETGTPPGVDVGYGDAYVTGYLDLWGAAQ